MTEYRKILTTLRKRLSAYFKEQSEKIPTEQAERNQEFLKTVPTGDEKLPRLSASQLSLQDVEEIFGLKEDLNRAFMMISEQDKLRVPEELEREMQEELEILEDRPKNEAECRLQINRLFYHCLKVERYALADAANPPPNLPSFALETSISLEVVHNGVRKMLKGDMDYSMKYAKDNIAAGLVVLEAKNLRTMSLGLSQCLAYMAMINVIRRRDGYMNAAIYGIISNGRDFQFLRIDNDSEWCEWRPERPWCNMTKDMIYTMLRLVIRNAVMSSPRVSSQLVRCISPSHPLTPHPDLYHLQVESDDSEDDDNEDNDGIDLGE